VAELTHVGEARRRCEVSTSPVKLFFGVAESSSGAAPTVSAASSGRSQGVFRCGRRGAGHPRRAQRKSRRKRRDGPGHLWESCERGRTHPRDPSERQRSSIRRESHRPRATPVCLDPLPTRVPILQQSERADSLACESTDVPRKAPLALSTRRVRVSITEGIGFYAR
jgi:hypothetical protein